MMAGVCMNFTLFCAFAFIYWSMDMRKHFTFAPSSPPTNDLQNVVYFTAITHTSTGFGDIFPKTAEAKAMTSLHVMSVWSTLMMLAAM